MPMPLLADREELVADHRPHGTMTGDATEPAWNGYLLTGVDELAGDGSRTRAPDPKQFAAAGLARSPVGERAGSDAVIRRQPPADSPHRLDPG
jgi:hypothetical protein